jgi:hypothetical protein
MIKHYCDICKEEIIDRDFRCELVVVGINNAIRFLNHKKTDTPQIREKRYQFCRKCLSEKLKGFDNI